MRIRYLAVSVMISVLILAPVFSDIAFAASTAGITPDRPFLYFFDTLFEKIDLLSTLSPEKRVEKALNYAEERTAEIEVLQQKNRLDLLIKPMVDYEGQLKSIEQEIPRIRDTNTVEPLLKRISANSEAYKETLHDILKPPEKLKTADSELSQTPTATTTEAVIPTTEETGLREQLKQLQETAKKGVNGGPIAVTPRESPSKVISATERVQPAPLPTVSLSVNPATITLGQSTTLSWSSTNAASCTLFSVARPASGSLSVTPPSTGLQQYSITCTGGGGSISSTATISVNLASTSSTPKPTVSLSISKTSFTLNEADLPLLKWDSLNVTACKVDDTTNKLNIITNTSGKGGYFVNPSIAGKIVYTITCTGGGGTASNMVTLTVNPKQTTLPATPTVPTAILSANPTTIIIGQSSALSWTSTNATSCVLKKGTTTLTSGGASGSYTVTPSAEGSTTYTVTCTGASGTAGGTVTIAVNAMPVVKTAPCTDGTLYGQCSTTKPKYCSSGILVDKAFACGCSVGYQVSGDGCILPLPTAPISLPASVEVSVSVPPSPHVYVIEDDGTLAVPDNNGVIPSDRLARKFFKEHPDIYDFIGFHFRHGVLGGATFAYDVQGPAEQGAFKYSPSENVYDPATNSLINRLVAYGTTNGGLLGGYVDSFDFSKNYVERPPFTGSVKLIDNFYFELIFHELTHYWGAYVPPELQEALHPYSPGHWASFTGSWLSTSQSTRRKYVESNGKYYWKEDCLSEPKHHDFDLYSMGLKRAEEVTQKLIVPAVGFTPLGLGRCGATEVSQDYIRRAFSIQDMINVLGPRVPSVADAQKDFTMAFVMIVPQGETLDQKERDALYWIANKFPVAWYKSTEGRSTINGIVPQDATPPVISNIQTVTTDNSITVSWNTNEPAASFVIYTPQQFISITYPNVITTPPKFFTTHKITVESSDRNVYLFPDTEYPVQIISIDQNYNMASYDVGVVRTKPQATSFYDQWQSDFMRASVIDIMNKVKMVLKNRFGGTVDMQFSLW